MTAKIETDQDRRRRLERELRRAGLDVEKLEKKLDPAKKNRDALIRELCSIENAPSARHVGTLARISDVRVLKITRGRE